MIPNERRLAKWEMRDLEMAAQQGAGPMLRVLLEQPNEIIEVILIDGIEHFPANTRKILVDFRDRYCVQYQGRWGKSYRCKSWRAGK